MTAYAKSIAKALVAGALAFCTGMVTAYADGHATAGEWWAAGALAAAALAAVWRVPNVPRPPTSPDGRR